MVSRSTAPGSAGEKTHAWSSPAGIIAWLSALGWSSRNSLLPSSSGQPEASGKSAGMVVGQSVLGVGSSVGSAAPLPSTSRSAAAGSICWTGVPSGQM